MSNGLLPRFLLEPTAFEPIDRALGAWFNWPNGRNGGLAPAMDVHEDEHSVVVTVELPGLTKDEVEVTLENGVLTIGGEKKVERQEEGRRFHVRERATGMFRRSVSLPTDVDVSKADAAFSDGVLTVRVPKTDEVKPKRLTVK